METQDIQTRPDLAGGQDLAREQYKMLLEQARIKHIFAPGAYIKAYSVPAGLRFHSKELPEDHVSILAKGSVYVEGPDIKLKLSAPVHFNLKAETRYLVVAIEDSVWYCVHPTDEADTDEIIKRY